MFSEYSYIYFETDDFSSILRRHNSNPTHDGILMHRKVSSCNGNLERYTMFTMKTLLRFYFFHTTHAYHSSRRNNIFRSLLRWWIYIVLWALPSWVIMNSTQDKNINIVLPIHIFIPSSLFVEVALDINFHPIF